MQRTKVYFPIFFIVTFFPLIINASDCLQYKVSPTIDIEIPKSSVSVTQPEKKMDLLHGDVVSTLSEEYEIGYEIHHINDGLCLCVKSVKAIVGYTNFVVQIDKSHEPNSCQFNAVKEHEYEHINAHLSVIDDEKEEIRQTVSDAANSVMPIFIEDKKDLDTAMNDLEKSLQGQPQIGLMRKKIYAEQEIRNKKVDINDRGERIQKCFVK
jgi:carboxypeptidase C (cathepsin A)